MSRCIKAAAALLTALSMLTIPGCSAADTKPEIRLSVWWSDEDDRELISAEIERFKEIHSDEAQLEITISTENVLTVRNTVTARPRSAADVYMFADDQFDDLYRAGALHEVTEDAEQIISANGGADNGVCRAVTRGGKLYGYPMTTGNGYFLYYNKSYFTEDDIKSLDRILEVSAQNGKKTAIDYSSGWYIYSFFRGAGFTVGLNEDGVTNHCDWNGSSRKYKGTDVAEAMLDIAQHKGFINLDDKGFLSGVQNGTVIAGINGAWNAETVKEAWGDDFAAVRLPDFTLAGDSVQMWSFSGYKLLGVNAYSKNAEWAMKLAGYLSSEEIQIKRFEIIGECPSNVNATRSPTVSTSPVIAALSAQSRFADTQRIANAYWNPTYIFGITMAGGNPDNKDLQELLDTMVSGITAPPEASSDPAAN